MNKKMDFDKVKRIMNEIIETIDNSKNTLLDIVENAREEHELLSKELNGVRVAIGKVIDEVDRLTLQDRMVRSKLAEVSKFFSKYKERDIKNAYEKASDVKVALISAEKEEAMLRARRDALELSLKRAIQNIENAEKVVQQVTVAVTYLKGEIMTSVAEAGNDELFFGLKLLEAQENERGKISRDLHDGPAQFLASIVMKAEICEALAMKDFEKAMNELSALKVLTRKALKEIRAIIHDLRPMAIDDLGLSEAIEAFAFEHVREKNIKVHFKTGKTVVDIEPIIKVAVYRLVGELINNAIKHALAHQISVSIEYGNKYLRVIVSDDGLGFDVEKTLVKVKESKSSYGLLGVKERVFQFGGTIDFYSKPGEGTTVTIQMPVNREVIQSD